MGMVKSEAPRIYIVRPIRRCLALSAPVVVTALDIIMYYIVIPISKTSRKSSVGSDVFEQSLLEELKASRPKSPPPLQKLSGDESYCAYLGSMMSDLPTNTKRRLQGEFISTVISELNY